MIDDKLTVWLLFLLFAFLIFLSGVIAAYLIRGKFWSKDYKRMGYTENIKE